MEAPHILIVSSWYPNSKQPFLGNFVERNAQLLGQAFHVSVIHLEAVDSLEESTIEKKQKGTITEIKASYPSGNLLSRMRNRSKIFDAALRSLSDVDVIIGHVLLPHGWMFLKAKSHFGCPLIWVEHGSYFRSDGKKKWSARERIIRSRVTAQAADIIAVSDFLKKDMSRYISEKKIRVLGNHVDETLFEAKPKVKNKITKFLHVSTLDPNTKNPSGILKACQMLNDKHVAFRLTIVSDEDPSQLKTEAIELGIADLITFEGPKSWAEMPQYYYEADAFILNSDYETFSIVLAEALSTGTPIIATPVGIANELPPTVCMQIEKNQPQTLSDAMLRIIEGEHSLIREEILKEGRKYHSSHILASWKLIIREHVQ